MSKEAALIKVTIGSSANPFRTEKDVYFEAMELYAKQECIKVLQMLLENNIRPTSHEAFYLKNNSINAKPGYYTSDKIYEFYLQSKQI